MNLARLFSFTRHIEAQLQRERREHANAIARVVRHYEARLLEARADFEQERTERQRLQDRLLQKSGVLPVMEESRPVMPPANGAKKHVTGMSRAVQRGVDGGDAMYQQIQAHIKEVAGGQSE